MPRRDPVDQRIIEAVRTGHVRYKAGKGIITDIQQVGGYPRYQGEPTLDSHDGIPTWWKIKYDLDPRDPAIATKDCNGDGYTNIEKYLNRIDPTRRLDFTDPKNNVDTQTRAKLVVSLIRQP